jgi:hypothetical protein
VSEIFALALLLIAAFAFGYHTGYDHAKGRYEFLSAIGKWRKSLK